MKHFSRDEEVLKEDSFSLLAAFADPWKIFAEVAEKYSSTRQAWIRAKPEREHPCVFAAAVLVLKAVGKEVHSV